MMRGRTVLLTLVLAAAASGRAHAQGSIFGLRGLGWLGRPVSARSAGTGGALDLLDPEMSDNPAALARFRSVAGWSVAAPTSGTFTGPSGSADLATVRFPLFGFAAVIPTRTVIGVSISDYLDRTYTLIRRDSSAPRNETLYDTTASRSIGGISDMSLGAGYRVTNDFMIGAAFHYYLGSSRLTTQRLFDTTATGLLYSQLLEQSVTDYRGFGGAVGLIATVGKLDFAASGRLNGRLRSENTTGLVATTQLPSQFGVSVRAATVPGVYISGAAEYAGWGAANADLVAAGKDGARDVWALAVGAEILNSSIFGTRMPLRFGYRYRQLPFLSLGQGINESAASGGIGLAFARDRTTIDLAFEHGSRSTGAEKETFSTLFVGLTVRP
ncbi:MAG: hypothetical protein ACHQX4_04830 [Gemmatimonadales bacterium]